MKEIPLTQGRFALVDDEDYDYLCQFNWCVLKSQKTYYAKRRFQGQVYLMHRVILKVPDGLEVDHKNHIGLDNRRSNLRIATRSQNNANHKLNSNNTSGLRGVYWHKMAQKWQAFVKIDGKYNYLGLYTSKEEAGRVVAEFMVKHYGEFANVNGLDLTPPTVFEKDVKGLLTFAGKSLTQTQWAKELGISNKLISLRLSRGWSVERALTEVKQED